jgi:hypothetical protein
LVFNLLTKIYRKRIETVVSFLQLEQRFLETGLKEILNFTRVKLGESNEE